MVDRSGEPQVRTAARLSDVAAAAGVSLSTASKVLNGRGRASEETRRRVLATAARLDFQPNALAKSFALGRSYTIGILANNAPETFTMPVLIGANAELSRYDMASLLYNADRDPELRAEHVRRLRARQVDGLLVIGIGADDRLPSVSGFPAPVVYVNGVSDSPRDASFPPENRKAGRMAAEHLIGLGRTRIAHITGDEMAPAVIDRGAGFREALREAGLTMAFGQPLFGNYYREWGFRAARRLLDADCPVDGLFAGNDEIGLGAFAAFREAGLRVPEDIAIVGYDNFSRITNLQKRVLTTVDPNLETVGSAAVRHLLRAIGGDAEPGVHSVDCTLVEGYSTVGGTPPGAPVEVVFSL
ncbi:LacI family DNA-binding transcriptional regulator [Streptomyces sp. NPDC001255]|uniref:LacI family DNA-binding transcriptional regulator n=1 Tax=Streptomyces sp. NPDC001255 TaxID=3364550 RepID=UPI0036B7416E